MSLRNLALVGAAGLISAVSAHGNVQGIVVDGKYYPGWDYSDSFESPLPDLIAWSTTVSDEGFVAPSDYTSSDIICHEGAKPGALSAKVAAGGTVKLEWTTWPDSHHGPVIDYLANCNGDCASVDKTSLEFFKISQQGLIDDSTPPGTWASDKLIAANNSWTVTIPSDIASGNYVLRHEIIALHSAGNADGAQNYPQCVNLQVTGGGSAKPSGEVATKFYKPTDKGILIDIYSAISNYVIPGPALYSGGGSSSGGASSAPAPPVSSTPPVASSAPAPPVSSTPPIASSAPAQSGGASYSAPAGSSAGAGSTSAAPSGTSYSAPAPSGPAPSGYGSYSYSPPASSSAGAVSGSSSSKCTSTITISSSAAGGSSTYVPGSSVGAVSSSIVPAGSSSGTGAFSLPPLPSQTSVPYPSSSASGGFSLPVPSGTSVPYPSASSSPSSVSPPIPSASSPAGYPSPPAGGSSPDMQSLMHKIIAYIKGSFRQAEHAKDFKKF